MPTNTNFPQIERKAMWFLINQPQVLESNTVDENWFTNNSYRILASFINLWGTRYENAEQIAAAFSDTPFGKRLDVQKIINSIQGVDRPFDPRATFKELRSYYYTRMIKEAALNASKDPSDFNLDHLDMLRDEAMRTDTQTDHDNSELVNDALEELNTPTTGFIKTYAGLDKLLGGGVAPNQLMVIGARPSVGSSLGRHKKPTMLASCSMAPVSRKSLSCGSLLSRDSTPRFNWLKAMMEIFKFCVSNFNRRDTSSSD